MNPKVSVIMPSLNVGKYIKQCIKSVQGQSLKDIEIICVDAGSTDGTLEILQEAASEDPRIRIINSDIKSYGYQMNLGLDAARGEYIGIVETDDWIEKEMFRELYREAINNDLDMVKSDFWFYYSTPSEKNILYKLPEKYVKKGVFDPLDSFGQPVDKVDFFNIKPSIWSAIYKKAFLDANDIRFNETPGASYQDASFNFKVGASAKRVKLLKDAYLHYRQDNEQSSVNSPSKVYCVCDEYKEIENFIKKHFSENEKQMNEVFGLMMAIKFDSYMWNLARLAKPLDEEFVWAAGREFNKDLEKGYPQGKYFMSFKWELLRMWINDPEAFMKAVEMRNKRSFFAKVIDKLKRKAAKNED